MLVLVLSISACASQGARGPATGSRNTLTADEMLKAGFPDAFMTVQSLRPEWLRSHGATSLSMRTTQSIKVYLDDSLLGGPESLRSITMRSISMIRYLDGLQASERWGLDHSMGAIVVVTRR